MSDGSFSTTGKSYQTMSLRQAFRQARWITVAVLAAIGWLLLTALDVVQDMQPFWGAAAPGQTAAVGVIGLLVMGGILVLSAALLGELGQPKPNPETWPPEE